MSFTVINRFAMAHLHSHLAVVYHHSRRRHPTSSATELDGPRRSLVRQLPGGSTVHAVRLWPTGSALRPCWRAAIIRQYGRVGRRGACVARRCPLVGATVLGGVGCVAGKRVAQCSEQEAAPGPAE